MRSFQADFVYPVHTAPVRNGLVLVEDDGTIAGVFTPEQQDLAIPKGIQTERLSGILAPGFVNTHCHLELSCMKGSIPERRGMAGFVSDFVAARGKYSPEQRLQGIRDGETEMLRNGIVAAGDISNDNSSFSQKARGNLYYHTFIETFDLNPSRTQAAFEQALALRNDYLNTVPPGSNSVSVVAHAPYTVTPELHRLITGLARDNHSILSIHSQESRAEEDLFLKGSGALMEMYRTMKLDFSWFAPDGLNSLQTILPFYKEVKRLQLVHNTFTGDTGLELALQFDAQFGEGLKLYWCTCPNANLYIENTLPDYNLLIARGAKVTVGTDSLASNTSLSVLEELKTISAHCRDIPLNTLLTWATYNGAEFLGIENRYGSLEKGKRPGLVLIDHATDALTPQSQARRIC